MSDLSHPGSALAAVLESNLGRPPRKIRLKLKRMAANPFAFFRGACPLFATTWKELEPPDTGPEILVCGDLHLENFGAYRDHDGQFLFDINDFDEALYAPSAIDPVRCATSILLAAELWKLSPLQANGMVLDYLDQYRSAVTTSPEIPTVAAKAPRLSQDPIAQILGKAAIAEQSSLLDRKTELSKNGLRHIIRSKLKHPDVGEARAEAVSEAFQAYGRSHQDAAGYQVLDVTGRVAGIGSLGVERYLVLVQAGGSATTNRLLDVKEEDASAWIGILGRSATPPGATEAARVVFAQRTLQARTASGLDVITIGDKTYRIREMIPEENRSSLDRLQQKPAKLREAILTAGHLTGRSHLRGATAGGCDQRQALSQWATSAALDSLLAAAARYAEWSRQTYLRFKSDLKTPSALSKRAKKTCAP